MKRLDKRMERSNEPWICFFVSEGLRPGHPADKHAKTDVHGKKQRSLNTGPSSLKAGGFGASTALANDADASITQVGKKAYLSYVPCATRSS